MVFQQDATLSPCVPDQPMVRVAWVVVCQMAMLSIPHSAMVIKSWLKYQDPAAPKTYLKSSRPCPGSLLGACEAFKMVSTLGMTILSKPSGKPNHENIWKYWKTMMNHYECLYKSMSLFPVLHGKNMKNHAIGWMGKPFPHLLFSSTFQFPKLLEPLLLVGYHWRC